MTGCDADSSLVDHPQLDDRDGTTYLASYGDFYDVCDDVSCVCGVHLQQAYSLSSSRYPSAYHATIIPVSDDL